MHINMIALKQNTNKRPFFCFLPTNWLHYWEQPENLLLSTKNRTDGTIKMIDFGCAVVADEEKFEVDPTKIRPTSNGTTAYWSPERFEIIDSGKNKFNRNSNQELDFGKIKAMDMWSVGVLIYIMLTGVHPFDIQACSTDQQIEEQIRKDPSPPLTPDLVGQLSDSAVELISQLMEKDPSKRLTAYEMLHHPWVRGETASKEKIQDLDKKLSNFKDIRQKIEALVFTVMVGQGYSDARMSEGKGTKSENDVPSAKTELPQYGSNTEAAGNRRDESSSTNILQKAFAAFDAEAKGYVTFDDLGRVATEKTGSPLLAQDTEKFLKVAAQHVSFPAADPSDENVNQPTTLSLSQFNKLFSGLNHKHFPRGHVIFNAGDTGDAMYFLSSGKVEIQTRKGQLVAILRSGDFFGEGSLLDQANVRFTSAKCATPVDVIEIKRADFDRYVGSSPTAKRDMQVKWRARTLQYAKNLLRLQTNVAEKIYKKGEVVYKEGDIGSSIYRVDDDVGGELEVSHNGKVVHKYLPGDSFGESSVLFNRPRS